jgi:ribosomal protein S18 acetylase RimI-like enzyme
MMAETYDAEVIMIRYTTSLKGIAAEMLAGFFVGWPKPPSAETHLEILRQSSHIVLAEDDQAGRVVGFVTAISDGILSAYIPLIEVLPEYRGRGIGTELVRRMLDGCKDLYMVDTTCDREVQAFYARCGMSPSTGMMIRNYEKQSGHIPVCE